MENKDTLDFLRFSIAYLPPKHIYWQEMRLLDLQYSIVDLKFLNLSIIFIVQIKRLKLCDCLCLPHPMSQLPLTNCCPQFGNANIPVPPPKTLEESSATNDWPIISSQEEPTTPDTTSHSKAHILRILINIFFSSKCI